MRGLVTGLNVHSVGHVLIGSNQVNGCALHTGGAGLCAGSVGQS